MALKLLCAGEPIDSANFIYTGIGKVLWTTGGSMEQGKNGQAIFTFPIKEVMSEEALDNLTAQFREHRFTLVEVLENQPD